MIDRILTVGGFTLLSRLTGFFRDVLMAAVLGAGPVADAFLVAFRLPNHFRAIFAEGAFNAAFVPAYARIREQGGAEAARKFADRIFTLLFASQLIFLALALIFTPEVIRLLAPGFEKDPGRFTLAVDLTRITFPYLLLMTLVTLYGGILNALNRFAAVGPAVIGSAGVQLALFADTIIASFLPAGALSALYYADRLNQLPIGVIGIAIGTVLLPEMSRRLTAGDQAGAMASQRRAFDFTLLFSVPFVAAFLTVPDVITRAMFARGAFSKADAAASGATLAAYAIGLIPFVLIVVGTFVYAGSILLLFGWGWLRSLVRS